MKELGERGVVALCGPSGVGKGYTKRTILQLSGLSFSEPVVVSTRHARIDDDPSRLAGLSDPDFDRLVESKEVILDHRPFRIEGSPRYGFLAESFVSDTPLLTEAHSSIVDRFRRIFEGRALIIGMVADKQTLLENITARQGSAFDGVGIDLRVASAAQEATEIFDAYAQGGIDRLMTCNPDERDAVQHGVITLVQDFIGDSPWKR